MLNKKKGLANRQALQVNKYNLSSSYIHNNPPARRMTTGDDDVVYGYLNLCTCLFVSSQM
ncbi:MAG: hypothetical protein CVT93_03760 [Bacteroidetes bacterium HGW-Bacteroidetes-10]|nr:MAG: hypothetical protein CVT93_03760 [Bacteroidetes bacterium HGW-Bacteroidetes-10]